MITFLPYVAVVLIVVMVFSALSTSRVEPTSASTLTPSPVEAWRVVDENATPLSDAMPSDLGDMPYTLAEHLEEMSRDDDWSGFERALVDYETAMLTPYEWIPDSGGLGVIESTEQRIMRWLRDGIDGDGAVREARAEVRRAGSETWDAPSRELPMVVRR